MRLPQIRRWFGPCHERCMSFAAYFHPADRCGPVLNVLVTLWKWDGGISIRIPREAR